MRSISRTIMTIGAAAAVVVATATTASAEADTPDDHWVSGGWWASVMWNDYENRDHGNDLDNVWIEDEWGDGYSAKLYVYRNGKLVDTAHAYNGDEASANDLGNVPNGGSVYWKSCLWNNGKPVYNDHGQPECWSGSFYE